MKFVDIGVNLTNKQFAKDKDTVIKDAVAAGVQKIILTGTNETCSSQSQELASQYPQVLYSMAGIHPHDAKDASKDFTASLARLYENDNVVAIGECGLDFNRDFSPRPVQESVFEQQLALAADLSAPVFMHQRDAHTRFIDIIKTYEAKIDRGIVHCFTGNKQELDDYLELGFSIGITGWICDERRGKDVLALSRDIPLDKLMIETDAPFLLPRDLDEKPKSRRNEPQFLPHILSVIAKQRNIDEAELAQVLWQNSIDFFRL